MNKIALITGARRGMGKAHALALAKQGVKVVVTDINLEETQKVADEINENGGEAVAFKMDVSDKKEIGEVFDKVTRKYGRLDVLVNNAGIFEPKDALKLTEEEFMKTIEINLKGEFLCAQRAAQEMKKNKWGRIINVSSVVSGQVGIGIRQGAHYAASKGGIIAMTEAMALEWAEFGINVNVIAPGVIDTPMVGAAKISEQEMGAMMKRISLGRMGKPEEVSSMVVFLSSEESSYITGATFYVDGGWLAA